MEFLRDNGDKIKRQKKNIITPVKARMITSRIFSSPGATSSRYGFEIDGRFLAKYGECQTTTKTRKPDQPILRGHFVELNTRWSEIRWLPGVEHRSAVIAVVCPYCDRTHLHGMPTFLTGLYMSSRRPHCPHTERQWPDSYYIAPYRATDAGYKQHVIRPGRVLVRRMVK